MTTYRIEIRTAGTWHPFGHPYPSMTEAELHAKRVARILAIDSTRTRVVPYDDLLTAIARREARLARYEVEGMTEDAEAERDLLGPMYAELELDRIYGGAR